MALVATGLTTPRSIEFDTNGNLLVVESGLGLTSLVLQDNGGACLTVKSSQMVIQNTGLNHGLALSPDGKTLYASTTDAAYSWAYDAASMSVGKSNTTLVGDMTTSDHTTRTLLVPQKVNGLLVISRGSTANIDPEAELLSSGHSEVKAFNLTNITSAGYDFDTQGLRLGWGLRNSVGVGEHPVTGGIYTVENSVDQLTRNGQDVHEDNPGEEMNFLGYLNGTKYAEEGRNFGYPYCFSVWVPADIPDNANLIVGSPFAAGTENNTINDTYCADETVAARLTFQAHQAPLDIKFNNSGTEGWVTFHGSWDRTQPVGYKVSLIQFENGSPVATASSNTSTTDIFTNVDNSKCPDNCFRPVGLAFDSQGRMFVSSDASGEIYVVVRDQSATGTANSTSTGSAPASTTSASSADGYSVPHLGALFCVLAGTFLLILT